MAAAYGVAEKSILASLDALLERIQNGAERGEPQTAAWLYQQQRYVDLLSQIKQAMSELADAAAPELADAQQAYIDATASAAKDMTAAALGAPPPGAAVVWNALPKSALETLVGFAGDGSPLRTLLDNLGPAMSKGVEDALVSGVAEGIGTDALQERILAVSNMTRARALTIARTEPMRAAREATRMRYAANADVVTGWIWVSAADRRTCPACWAMHGTEHPLTETLDGHPRCRCTMAPIVKAWSEIEHNPELADIRPQIPTGEEIFGGLSEDAQRAILGSGAYDLYSNGRISLADMVHQDSNPQWGTMRRVATHAQALASAEGRQ